MDNVAGVSLGMPTVITTQNRGMSADEWVDLAVNKIVSVADTAPMPLREQAYAYRDQIKEVLRFYFKKVARSERTSIAALLRKEGFPHIADKIIDIV